MGLYSHFFKTQFNGCPKIGSQEDEGRKRTQNFYYIGEPHLFGICDGVDSWIAPLACLSKDKREALEEQMRLAESGELKPEEEPEPRGIQRRKISAPVVRRKIERPAPDTVPTHTERRRIMKKT